MNKIHRSNVNIKLAFSSRLYCLDYKNPEDASQAKSKLTFFATIILKNALSLLRFASDLIMLVLKPIIFMLLKLLTTDQKLEAIEYLAKVRLLEIEQAGKPTSRRNRAFFRHALRISRPILKPMASRTLGLFKPVLTLTAYRLFKSLRPEEKLETIENLAKIKLQEINQVKKSTRIKMQQMLEALRQDSQLEAKDNLEKPAKVARPQTLKKRNMKPRLLLARNLGKISRYSRYSRMKDLQI